MKTPFFYVVVQSIYHNPDKSIHRYGIAVVEAESMAIIKTLSDVSPSMIPVMDLVDLCNRLHLDPKHLEDVVEDLLS